MPPPRRKLQETVQETLTPPESLTSTQFIARVKTAAGNNLYNVELADNTATILVELDPRFRSKIWLKRGGFVLVDTATLSDRKNKIDGEIINVVRDEKAWRRSPFWPKEFMKSVNNIDDSDEDSRAGKMPPSEDESD